MSYKPYVDKQALKRAVRVTKETSRSQNPRLGKRPELQKFSRYDDHCPNRECGENIGRKFLSKAVREANVLIKVNKDHFVVVECPHCGVALQLAIDVCFSLKEIDW